MLCALLHWRRSYDVYDAQQYAPARPFLSSKRPLSADASSQPASPFPLPPYPGGPDRWRLEDDPTGMDQLGRAMEQMNHISQLVIQTKSLQGLNILLLVLRMFKLWSALPRLRLITITLAASVAPLAEFFLVLSAVVVLLSALGHIEFGGRSKLFSTFGSSLVFNIEFLVAGESFSFALSNH